MTPDPRSPDPARPRDLTTPAALDDRILTAIDALPPNWREAVIGRFFHGERNVVTADRLGCHFRTVKGWRKLAIDRIRVALGLEPLAAAKRKPAASRPPHGRPRDFGPPLPCPPGVIVEAYPHRSAYHARAIEERIRRDRRYLDACLSLGMPGVRIAPQNRS